MKTTAVKGHCAPSPKFMTGVVIADYLEQVAPEDASSYFVTPPGSLRRIIHQTISPLNDLEAKETVSLDSSRSNNNEYLVPVPSTHESSTSHDSGPEDY